MERFGRTAVMMFFLVVGCGLTPLAGQEPAPFRAGNEQLEPVIARLAMQSKVFRRSLQGAIKNSFLFDAPIGIYINRTFLWEFEWLADRLKSRLKDHRPVSAEVQEVLNRAEYLDTFMSSYELDSQSQSDWRVLRGDLDRLAQYYRIKTVWNRPVIEGIPQPVKVDALTNRLNGTYQLDNSQSAHVHEMVTRIAADLPAQSRRRIMNMLKQRLKSPELLAINQQGDAVTLATSLHQARIYQVVGRTETSQGERPATQLFGGQFSINLDDESDGFSSTSYNSIYQGSGLEVIHTVYLNQFKRPLVVVTRYKKISDVPQMNLFTEESVETSN